MPCKAQSKRHGRRCRNAPMRGLEVCRMHGGKTPRGPASVHFKSGKYSKFLPSRLFAECAAAAQDPELLSRRRDIALTEARITDILQRVDTGESGALWRAAQAAMAKFALEQARGHVEGMQLALATVQRLISSGADDYAAWQEIGALLEQRRRLCESEQRRLTLAHEVLTAEQATVLLGRVVDVISQHVRDRQALAAIALELQGLGCHGDGSAPHANAAGRNWVVISM